MLFRSQGLVSAVIGVDRHGTVRLGHNEPRGAGQVRREAAGVVNRASGYNNAHDRTLVQSSGADVVAKEMPVTVISTVGVVGLGTMGAGILEVFAKQGLTCVAVEVNTQALDRGRDILEASLTRAVERGKVTQEAAETARARIEWTLDLDRLADVDLVIEAVPERMEIKRDLFGRLDALCKDRKSTRLNSSHRT